MFNKEYKISSSRQELNPEDTFADTYSGHESMEVPISPSVFRIFGLIVVCGLILLGLSALNLQVVQGQRYLELSLKNSALPYAVSPPRGVIYDRNGDVVVRNNPSFDIVVVSRELDESEIPEIALTLGEIMNVNFQELEANLNKWKNESVFFLQKNIGKQSAIKIENLKIKGIYTVVNAVRDYIYGEKMSHMVGYVSKVSPEDLRGDSYYRTTDIVGKLGIEDTYEEYLRGDHGAVQFEKKFGSYVFEQPTIGDNLVLNVDAGLQVKLYDTMQVMLLKNGLTRGAAVIQDPNTGGIMAMVSFPSFDNNDFIESLSKDEYNRYFEDQNKPMFNRIVSGRYNPGSTIKPLIALAALEEGIIDPNKIILSTGQITIANQYNPEIVYVFHDWKPLGWVNMKAAIAMSSNIYFYHLGGGYDDVEGLGLERIRKYMKFFLIDDVLEIDLGPEAAGFIPSAEWKEETFGEPWYKGDTFNITIGQGDLLVTPLWLNSFTAAIANGGTIYKPQIVQSIIDKDKNVIKKFEPEILTKLPFSPGSFDIVREGMHEVTLTGTARSLANMSVSAAAKSGTAQLGSGIKRVNSFFNVYAPFEDPEIVITILIEEPQNPNLANGVAKEVIEWYFGQSKENMIE